MTSACSKWVVPIPVVNLKASVSQIASEVNGLADALLVRRSSPGPAHANSIVSNGTISPGDRVFARAYRQMDQQFSQPAPLVHAAKRSVCLLPPYRRDDGQINCWRKSALKGTGRVVTTI